MISPDHHLYHHSYFFNKAFIDPFSPLNERDVKVMETTMGEIHEHFKDHVRQSRGDRIGATDESELFSGAFWTGHRAVELGLADGVKTAHAHLRQEFGDRVRTVWLRPGESPLAQLMGAEVECL